MLDNLRDEDNSKPFFQDDAEFTSAETTALPETPRARSGRFLGMTPIQRFVIVVMIMFLVCALGLTCLLLTSSIGIYL
jgi:hypothetical protein